MGRNPVSGGILRTIYVPCDVDRDLRELAFRRRTSKNEVIIELLKIGLGATRIARELSGPLTPEKKK